MSVYRDKRGRLFIQFQYKGTTYKERLPAGTTTKKAEALELKIKSDLMFSSHGVTPQKNITFEQFLAQYFGPYADKRYSKTALERELYT